MLVARVAPCMMVLGISLPLVDVMPVQVFGYHRPDVPADVWQSVVRQHILRAADEGRQRDLHTGPLGAVFASKRVPVERHWSSSGPVARYADRVLGVLADTLQPYFSHRHGRRVGTNAARGVDVAQECARIEARVHADTQVHAPFVQQALMQVRQKGIDARVLRAVAFRRFIGMTIGC
jgi:hypothetical protein